MENYLPECVIAHQTQPARTITDLNQHFNSSADVPFCNGITLRF